jgi:methyl-accepting chemotaxis protein
VTSARNAQKKHWMRLLSGDFGEGYAASADRIGRTHARINLPLDVYMSAYALSSGEMLGILAKGGRGGFFRRRGDASGLVDAVSRAFAFDIELVTTVTFAVWGEEQDRALGYLNAAIDALAEGDLTHRIPSPGESDYPVAYDAVRQKINGASENLGSIVAQVARSMDQMLQTVVRVNASADDLSHRTNSQAASLEETAAAMEEITASIRQSTQATQKSNEVAQAARGEMEKSADIVGTDRPSDGRHQDLVRTDLADHRPDRRHRVPDQPPCAECRCRSRARRRGGARLRRRGRRGADPRGELLRCRTPACST